MGGAQPPGVQVEFHARTRTSRFHSLNVPLLHESGFTQGQLGRKKRSDQGTGGCRAHKKCEGRRGKERKRRNVRGTATERVRKWYCEISKGKEEENVLLV